MSLITKLLGIDTQIENLLQDKLRTINASIDSKFSILTSLEEKVDHTKDLAESLEDDLSEMDSDLQQQIEDLQSDIDYATEKSESDIEEAIYKLLHPQVEIVTSSEVPTPASDFSAGYDIRADLSNFKEKFAVNATAGYVGESCRSVTINPGGHCLIPTGIYTSFPEQYRVEIVPRSGLALKFRITITNSPGTIEGDYKNEWGVIIDNEGDTAFTVYQGDRICQAIFSLIVRPQFIQKEKPSDLSGNDRGGGFGHTGV